MITSVKQYGSYLLTKATPYDGEKVDSDDAPQFIGGCAIPSKWTACKLLALQPYNHDTTIFTFALPEGSRKLQLPVGGCLLALAPGAGHDSSDAVRPYTSVMDDDANDLVDGDTGTFAVLCKRYDQWGMKEAPATHFLFTRTDHSYRPAGAVSNYIHRMAVGDCLQFKHSMACRSRVPFPLLGVASLTLLAVGVGIAPMVSILRAILKTRRKEHARYRG